MPVMIIPLNICSSAELDKHAPSKRGSYQLKAELLQVLKLENRQWPKKRLMR